MHIAVEFNEISKQQQGAFDALNLSNLSVLLYHP
jgi:hypothetical protein